MYRVREARRRDCVARCRLDDSVDSETRYASRRGISDGPEVIESAVTSQVAADSRLIRRRRRTTDDPRSSSTDAPADKTEYDIYERGAFYQIEQSRRRLAVWRACAPERSSQYRNNSHRVHERTLTVRRIKRLEGHPWSTEGRDSACNCWVHISLCH